MVPSGSFCLAKPGHGDSAPPLRDAEHHAESFRVAHGGRVCVSECIDIESKRLLQHLSGQLDIINIERADTTRPEHNTEVVIRARGPERFRLRGIREIATRLVPSGPFGPFSPGSIGTRARPKVSM